MDEDQFNLEIRRFLKKVGITSQREIEKAVRAAVEQGSIAGNETLKVRVNLTLDEVGLALPIDGEIKLS